MTELQLDTLEAKGLIRLATIQPELEYLFRHALVQDTAYESLLKQERRGLHRLVGDALEELYPDRRGDLAAVLAMHFEQAGDTEKAIRYLVDAAKFAYERNAIVEAFELYTRADALLPAGDIPADNNDMRRIHIEIALGQARSGFPFLASDELLAIVEPAIAEAESLGDPRGIVAAHLTAALVRQFRGESPQRSEPLRSSLDRIAQIAAELNDPLIEALPKSIVGLFQVFTGDLHKGIEALEQAAPLLAQKRDFVGSSFANVALTMGYARLGDFDKSEVAARRSAEFAENGDLVAKLDSLIGRSNLELIRGDLDSAVPLALQCTTMSEERGATACVIGSNLVLGDAYMQQGKFQQAQAAFERGNQVANAVQQHSFRPSITAFLRSNAASMGDYGPNARTFDEAIAEARENGDRWAEANVLWQRAETESKKPADESNVEQMLADYAAAVGGFQQMAARPFVARASRAWGSALRSVGRTDEGNEKLRRALALLDELGISREANAVRAALELTPSGPLLDTSA